MTSPRHHFYALPDTPHLTQTYLGYTLMTLNGLSPWLTVRQIDRITINGVDHQFKPMGDQTLMLIPSFRQEAQTVGVHCKGDRVSDHSSFGALLRTISPNENLLGSDCLLGVVRRPAPAVHGVDSSPSYAPHKTPAPERRSDLSAVRRSLGLTPATHNRYLKES